MLSRRNFLRRGTGTVLFAAGASLPGAYLFAQSGNFKSVAGKQSLKQHAHKHDLLFGSAVNIRSILNSEDYRQLIADQCTIIVPHAELKWVTLRPSRGQYDFSQVDKLLEFAQQHHILLRGHTLCWHESVPDWIKTPENSKDARQLFVDHINTVCGHYAGHIHSWDVVNEAILPKDGQPGGLRKSFWYENVGPDYIELAFRTARKADPHALLTYNDYGVEFENDEDGERRDLILKLLRDLKQKDVPLDAFGVQSHIKAAQTYGFGKGLANFLAEIRKLGLQIYLTELDVNEDDIKDNDLTVRDEQIAQTYSDYLKVALAEPNVRAVLTWEISDRYTWLNNGPTHHRKQPDRPQRSLPFDKDFNPKKAFFAVRDSFDARKTNKA